MKNILLLHCHPWPHKSRYNRRLIEKARKLNHVEVRDLYELYPALHINEEMEQEALEKADVVVFQYPIYWYSAPALLKEWVDVVLQSGFAFGEDSKLRGKRALLAVSTGGDAGTYSADGKHGADIDVYLQPMMMTAKFCGMETMDPFVSHSVRDLDYDQINSRAGEFCDLLTMLGKGER